MLGWWRPDLVPVARHLPHGQEELERRQMAYKSKHRAAIDAAFAELETHGIIARADFQCCTGCGCSAMAMQEREAWTGAQPAVGGVFFHAQDTDAANAGGSLWLNHRSFVDTEAENVRVAELTCRVLCQYGFDVRWSGDTTEKIQVIPPNRRWDLNYVRPHASSTC